MGKCVTGWPGGPGFPRSEEKGIGSKLPGEKAKKKAGFFFRILVLESPEFEKSSLAVIFSGAPGLIQMLKISMMKNC